MSTTNINSSWRNESFSPKGDLSVTLHHLLHYFYFNRLSSGNSFLTSLLKKNFRHHWYLYFSIFNIFVYNWATISWKILYSCFIFFRDLFLLQMLLFSCLVLVLIILFLSDDSSSCSLVLRVYEEYTELTSPTCPHLQMILLFPNSCWIFSLEYFFPLRQRKHLKVVRHF